MKKEHTGYCKQH